MASFRRYRKGSRRYRKLTKASIYGNRSARAQSRQIARLNSKVNYLTRQNRPEIYYKYWMRDRTFTNSALASNYEIQLFNPWMDGSGEESGVAPEGTFARNRGINIKFNFEYSDNWSGNVSQSENHQRTATYRIVILQNKSAGFELTTDSTMFDRIFNVSSTIASNDDNIIRPLKPGLTNEFKVLFSKAYTISNQHPSRLHNITIPAKRCLNYGVYSSGTGSTLEANYAKGTVIIAILTGGLHADVDFNSQITCMFCPKLVYTDN